MMGTTGGDAAALTPEESWGTIHETLDRTRNSIYLAGTSTILVLWGVIVSLGYFWQYAYQTMAGDFFAGRPWIPLQIWIALGVGGMVGSGIIGHRATRRIAPGVDLRRAGIRVGLFWLAVVTAAFLLPGAAGLWNSELAARIPYVVVGIVGLGYVLFGIMFRPALAMVGLGIAVSFYLPSYLAGDAGPAVSGAATLLVAGLGWAWIRKTDSA
jgi:hypothetical protein